MGSTIPILVAGALRTASGLGESARLCHDALRAGSLPVYGVDLTAGLMQAQDAPDFGFVDGRALEGPGTLILHVNSPLLPLAMCHLGHRLVRGKRIVGYWAWELAHMPRDWRHGIPFVHEIWTPSTFTAEAIKPIVDGRLVHVVPYPVAINPPRAVSCSRAGTAPFTVLTLYNAASSFARKNPLASIAAFRQAFGDDPLARLIIKTQNSSVYRPGVALLKNAVRDRNNIVLLDQTISQREMDELYAESDVVISLHRSEGFGLTLAEAMLRALPVVATDWSGNVDFINQETGIPVPYRLVPAEDPQATYNHPDMSWADPDIEAAALALRRLRDDSNLANRLGHQAARFASQAWSGEAYTSRVRRYLQL